MERAAKLADYRIEKWLTQKRKKKGERKKERKGGGQKKQRDPSVTFRTRAVGPKNNSAGGFESWVEQTGHWKLVKIRTMEG